MNDPKELYIKYKILSKRLGVKGDRYKEIATRIHELINIRKSPIDVINLLDIGCGTGKFSKTIVQANPSRMFNIIGVDFDPAMRQPFISNLNLPTVSSLNFYIADLKSYPSQKDVPFTRFDLIVAGYSLYYFPQVISFLVKLLKKNGIGAFLTSSEKSLATLFKLWKETLHTLYNRSKDDITFVERTYAAFSAENGPFLIKPFFDLFETKSFKDSMIFLNDFSSGVDLTLYLIQKWSGRLECDVPQDAYILEALADLLERVQAQMNINGLLSLNKADTCFFVRHKK